MKYPIAVAPKPVVKAIAPSSAITYLNPPTIPLLYLTGSNYILVFTTSTGHKPPWVKLQQIPPDKAPPRKYFKLYLLQS